MFKRKLTAIDCHFIDDFNPQDETQFRNFILWLEDQKIRHYKIEEREGLRQFKNDAEWNTCFEKYLKDVSCPYSSSTDRHALIDWLLGFAVRLEYGDNVKLFKEKFSSTDSSDSTSASNLVSQNPLDSLNFDDKDFKEGVENLAKLLNITKHPDHLITLKAICKVVQEKLSVATVNEVSSQKSSDNKPKIPMKLEQIDLGFDTGDNVLNNAAKSLRLLHINEIRELQTKINEAIVALQQISANPKTDDKLGQVGF